MTAKEGVKEAEIGLIPEDWGLKIENVKDTIEIEIYADEIVLPKDFNNKTKNFICIGCLFVPLSEKKKLVHNLSNSRCLYEKNEEWTWDYKKCLFSRDGDSQCKKQWHDQNTCEIHHADLRSSRSNKSQKDISKKWLDLLIRHNKRDKREIYFNILYIELDKLQIENFGQEKVHENIYNRFFRTTIDYGMKYFFSGNKKIVVKKVIHDKGSMEFHKYFPYLNLIKLDFQLGENMAIENTDVIFVDSDHRNYLEDDYELVNESQLIQFIDLIIGSTTQNIFYLSNDSLKKEVAMIIRPLVKRLLENPYNKHSSYNYFKKQKITFFPKNKIEDAKRISSDLYSNLFEEFGKDNFYTKKTLDMPAYDPNQTELSSWCSNEN
ncbi:hypothetical protein [Methanohalophilus sp.]|uniref:hypothetical protein n=1 Tax=Methanohalophilus sp. TaxID=1966352 RepID=UPI00261CA89F|nr:hypothetical protein [Methanohalophilus sp.]MDK2892987.1 hypothetical protein [Methanohalophilus sp.]